MSKLARDVMTADPACCSPNTTLDQVAAMMVQNDCGGIPVVDTKNTPVGIVTDRDIVCRSVAERHNPTGQTAEIVMSRNVVSVKPDAPLDDVLSAMESHKIRRVLVTDGDGCCTGIIAQADIATDGHAGKTAELVREVSRASASPTR